MVVFYIQAHALWLVCLLVGWMGKIAWSVRVLCFSCPHDTLPITAELNRCHHLSEGWWYDTGAHRAFHCTIRHWLKKMSTLCAMREFFFENRHKTALFCGSLECSYENLLQCAEGITFYTHTGKSRQIMKFYPSDEQSNPRLSNTTWVYIRWI